LKRACQYPKGFKGKQVKFLYAANAVTEESSSRCHWETGKAKKDADTGVRTPAGKQRKRIGEI
jgi:hypothetical protein